MHDEWQTFLENQGAVVQAGQAVHLGHPEAELHAATHGHIIAALADMGIIRVQGADAVNFLQSQLTCDVSGLDQDDSVLGAYCTPKGRIVAHFRLFRRGESLYLRLPADLLVDTIERLKKYILMSQVSLDDYSGSEFIVGCSGPDIETMLHPVCGSLPQEINQVVHTTGYSIIRVPGSQPRFEISAGMPQLQALWTALDDKVTRCGPDAWTLLDIKSGLPNIHRQTMEAFLPQMVNLDLLGGVSFNKGCYPGQEIVARTRYLGTLKRRMHLVHIRTADAVPPGTPVYSGTAGNGQTAGAIVEAMKTGTGDVAALAVLKIALLDAPLSLRDADGPRLELADLPYSLQPDD